MKKHSLLLMKIVVGLTILIGTLLILITNEIGFKKIITDDIENISKLSASTIYSEIDNSLTKPIYVGQTMASDLFLKNWLTEEGNKGPTPQEAETMKQYLLSYSEKYGYDSVFVVSAKSNIYYYHNGINKVVSTENAHDVWYYDFIKSGKSYDLDVDMDEVNNDQLTVFSNSRIVNDKGELMGVAGVGVKMVHLQKLLQKYEDEYDLRAVLISEDGLIQVDSVSENIEAKNLFDNEEMSKLKLAVISNKADMQTFWYPDKKAEHCLITQYIDNLDWYIAIEKNTAATQILLSQQVNRDLLLIALIIILVLLMISYIIGQYNRVLLKTASIDDVTNLPNVKMFQQIFTRNSKRLACHTGMLFLFDIDKFKTINDTYGHLFGNTILYRISEISQKAINGNGLIARWGGDEFVGVIYDTDEKVDEILNKILSEVAVIDENAKISISIGATHITTIGNLDMMLREADTAMYDVKKNGGNGLTYSR